MRIAIWGTSGSGKTTLINNLSSYPQFKNYKKIIEPIATNPYFRLGYSSDLKISKDNSYKTEIWMLTHRLMQMDKHKNDQNVFFDRSLLDSIVFAHTDYKTGRLSKRDWEVFESYFSNVVIPNLKLLNPFDFIIYLKVNNKVALQRLYSRGFRFEVDFDREFWEQLNKSYEHYLDYMKHHFPKQFMVLWGNANDSNLLAENLVKVLNHHNKQRKLSSKKPLHR